MSNLIDNAATGFGGTIIPSGGSISLPLDLSLVDGGETFTGVFRPGTVNGLIPGNYTGLTGIAKTGTVYIILNITLANASVTAATFATAVSAPAGLPVSMGVPPTAVTILTHLVVDGAVLRVLGTGSPWLQALPSFETDKTGTIYPGERSTDIWYTYTLTSS